MHLVRADQLCRLHTAHKRHGHIHLSYEIKSIYFKQGTQGRGRYTHEDDVKRPVPLHARLKRVYRKRPILRDFDCVPVLLEDFDGQLLVNEVVFRK